MTKIACTMKEATAISGLSRSYIYRLFGQGKLKPRKCGKRVLIIVSELDTFLNSLPRVEK